MAISSKSWTSQAQEKASQAIGRKLLGILFHVMSERTQSALREEQGWNYTLWCWQRLAAKVCMK